MPFDRFLKLALLTLLLGSLVLAGLLGCGGSHQPTASEQQKPGLTSHLRGPVSVLLTISADPVRDAIDSALRSELSRLADVRFANDEEDGVVDLKVDVLITSLPDDGAILTVSTETGGFVKVRAMMLDSSKRLPEKPYAARKVVARQNILQACAEVAAGINEAVFERYLRHAGKPLPER
jgi:hypothetical protein